MFYRTVNVGTAVIFTRKTAETLTLNFHSLKTETRTFNLKKLKPAYSVPKPLNGKTSFFFHIKDKNSCQKLSLTMHLYSGRPV